MRLVTYQAHNVLRVSDIQFDLDGYHLFLVGGANDQGKTSALTALLMALCGRSGMDYPEVALKEGESEGWVKVALEGEGETLNVELFLTRKKDGSVIERFRIRDDKGREVNKPRDLLTKLYHMRAFDPLAFDHMDAKAKRSMLQDLLGLDFAEDEAERKRLFEERTGVNRDVKRLDSQVAGMTHHSDAPDEEVRVSELVAELEKRRKNNDRKQDAVHQADAATFSVQDREREVRETIAEIDRLKQVVLEKQKLVEEAKELESRLRKDADSMPLANTEEIASQIESAEETNRKVRENAARKEKAAEADAAKKRFDELTAQIQAIDDKKQAALESADWPVDGLSFCDGGVSYKGLPIEQACKSTRTTVSARIGMALNPDLRLLVCQGGSDLDLDTLAALEKTLKENDFQMIVEMVTRGESDEERCAVVIENGKAK